jgi:putative peptidoglycan lipid II flippase
MFVSFFSIAVNALANWFFIFRLGRGHEYLALSTSIVATINFLLLYFMMGRHARLQTSQLAIALAKTLLAGAAMGAFLWWARGAYLGNLAASNTAIRALFVLPIVGAGAALYFGICHLLRLTEATDFIAIFRRKIGV